MRISDWSSDVCSSDLFEPMAMRLARYGPTTSLRMRDAGGSMWNCIPKPGTNVRPGQPITADKIDCGIHPTRGDRSEEHTSELQSLMRISYAVFCLKKKNKIR